MGECVVPMKKPGSCRECFDTHRCFGTGEWYPDGTLWCGLAKGYIGDKRTKCPVIELPEGHGRLVDADALIEQHKPSIFTMVTDFTEGQRSVVANIKNAPTIVPAEK